MTDIPALTGIPITHPSRVTGIPITHPPVVTGIPITHPPGVPGAGTARAQTPETNAAARHAANEFESVFLTEMLQPMFEGIGTDGIGEGGDGEQMFRPMLIEQYAQAIAKSGGVGIADNILNELTRIQSTPAQGTDDGADR